MLVSAKEMMLKSSRTSLILHEIDDDERRHLQSVLLHMLEDIIRVCEKQSIKCALVGGSALGAIRHHGFIPWDDDVDIAIPREDWTKFKVCFNDTLGEKYVLEAPNYNNSLTKQSWGKVYLKNTIYEEIHDVNMPYYKGIFIDIFICDYISKNKIIKYFDGIVSDFVNGVLTSQLFYLYPNPLMDKFMSSNNRIKLIYSLRRLLGFSFSWCSHERLCNWYDNFVSRHKKSNEITISNGRKGYLGEIMPADSWYQLRKVPFDNLNVYVYSNVEYYLETIYGKNYMMLPPLNKRERHFVVQLKFN